MKVSDTQLLDVFEARPAVGASQTPQMHLENHCIPTIKTSVSIYTSVKMVSTLRRMYILHTQHTHLNGRKSVAIT